MNPKERMKEIRARLEAAFAPETLGVEDESHLHEGHVGARDGRGHFRVLIIAEAFSDKSPLDRHRMVYKALGDLMRTDIHALAIDAWSPQELDRDAG
jgi:BolA protein